MACNHAYVDVQSLITAEALELPLLQNAQELDLDIGRNVADLVEHDCAGVGEFEFAGLGYIRAGKGPFLVAEQLALHQVLGQSGAVDFDERPVFARGVKVYGAGNQILTDAALAGEEDGGARGRHAHHSGENLLHPRTASDNVVPTILAPQLLFEVAGSLRARLRISSALLTTAIS